MRELLLKLKSNKEVRDFCRLMSLMKKRVWLYWTTLLLSSSIFAICLNIFMASVLRGITDAAVEKNIEVLLKNIRMAAILVIITSVLAPSSIYICIKCIKKTMIEVRLSVFEHLLQLQMKYFDTNHSGSIVSRLLNDMGMMENVYFFPIFYLLMYAILGIGSIIYMFFLNWTISLALIMLGVISVLINTVFSKPLENLSVSIQEATGKLTANLSDILNGSSVIKMLNIYGKISDIFNKRNTDISNSALSFHKQKGLLDSINYTINIISLTGMIALGIIKSIRDIDSLGASIACISLQSGISNMFTSVGRFIAEIRASLAGARRVFEIMDEPVEKIDTPSGEVDVSDSDGIMIKGLTFGYQNQIIFQNVTLQLEKEKFSIITGASGCGKSTLLKLIAGLYIPDSGSIFINQRNISDYSVDQLREIVSYVSQDPFLFKCSIAENIRMGRLDATDDEIIHAAQIANAHGFIMQMPDGYNTVAGENGSKLSGGQKQRIALARVLLKRSSIILLDEATSALDQETEKIILSNLKEELKGHTVIMVTHRLSNAVYADNIVSLDNLKGVGILV